jgi:hypothetical protein
MSVEQEKSIGDRLNTHFNPSNKVTHQISKARMPLIALYFFISFLYLFLVLILAGLFIQHDPTPDSNSSMVLTKSSNAGISIFFIISTLICIIVECFVVMNIIVGGGYFTSLGLYAWACFMPVFQFCFGMGISSVIIDRFKPLNDSRKINPDSGTYRLAQATITFLFIYCIASIAFFWYTYPLKNS